MAKFNNSIRVANVEVPVIDVSHKDRAAKLLCEHATDLTGVSRRLHGLA